MSLSVGSGQRHGGEKYDTLQLDMNVYRHRTAEGKETPFVAGVGFEIQQPKGDGVEARFLPEVNGGMGQDTYFSGSWGVRYSAKALAQVDVRSGAPKVGARALVAPYVPFGPNSEPMLLPGVAVEFTQDLKDGSRRTSLGVGLPF